MMDYEQYLKEKIHALRKEKGMTQEQLASELGLSYQAVSKWETGVACPDIMTLPKIADIFNISIDALFRANEEVTEESDEPNVGEQSGGAKEYFWPNDDTYRIVVYKGHDFVDVKDDIYKKVKVEIHERLANVTSYMNLTCDEIRGNVNAGGSINCDEIGGDVNAGGSINCDEVQGDVKAGGNVTCDEVYGNVTAGSRVICDEINGQVFGNVR